MREGNFWIRQRELAAEGLIEYDWVRYEEGNLIDRIFLRTEEAAVRQSYLRIGRVRKQAQLDVLESQVQARSFQDRGCVSED